MKTTIENAEFMREQDAWSDVPCYPRSDWQYEAANGDTQRGYWDWVFASIEADTEESLA